MSILIFVEWFEVGLGLLTNVGFVWYYDTCTAVADNKRGHHHAPVQVSYNKCDAGTSTVRVSVSQDAMTTSV